MGNREAGAGRAIWSRNFIALFAANSMLTLGQFIINAILATYKLTARM